MKKYLKSLLLIGTGCVVLGGMGVFGYCSLFECKLGELVIKTFDDCVAQGFPVENSDPPKCIVSKEKIFVQPPQNIRLTEPRVEAVVTSPMTIKGAALVQSNTVYYRLTGEDKRILAEASATTSSTDHGRFGDFSFTVNFDRKELESGTLEVFEKDPSGKESNMVKLPVNFTAYPTRSSNAFDPLKDAPTSPPAQANINTPFTSQAPFADWSDTYNEACEEASLIIVEYFLRGKDLTANLANAEIITLINWEKKNGYEVDVTVEELAAIARTQYKRLAKTYSGDEVTEENIKRLVAAGHPVILPAAGRMLQNPYFSGDGPPYHMIVITGYDDQGFIVQDPGTKRGKNYRYSVSTVMNAIRDWTGSQNTIASGKKAILVIGK